ncbi:MAG: alkaline phosphatase family protein [Bryobacteraceae bacterium]
MTRRTFLSAAPAFLQRKQRTVVFLVDGLGGDYVSASEMPVLESWKRKGVAKTVGGVMPSVTNANNTSVCCGAWPEEHGITANFFLDEETGTERYMESASLVLRPTLFERAGAKGVESALLSAKKKTVSLLPRGAKVAMTAEEPGAEWTRRLGPAPHIYSPEINHWLLKAAIDVLRREPEIGVVYVHTTDYPMHMWPPEARESRTHLARLDELFGELAAAARDAAILLTADHGMHHKSRCWDLEKACAARGVAIRTAISAEQDKYLKHHRGFGGTAWVYLKSARDADRAAEAMGKLPGVLRVLTRTEAAQEFRLMPSRIGELVVLGDGETVFGGLDAETQSLPPEYRSHGGLSEAEVPLVAYNAEGAPEAEYFRHNVDLARWLFR